MKRKCESSKSSEATACPVSEGKRPVFVNYDDTHFVHSRSKAGVKMTVAEMRRMVRQYKGTDVTDLLFCVSGRIADVPNAVKESWIDKYHQKVENGIAVDYTEDIYARAAHDQYEVKHVDRVAIWLDEARKCGIRPWLSFRMNDCHENFKPTSFLHPEFFHRHPEYRRIRHRAPELYFDRCFDFAVREIRDRELGYIGEMLSRYDTDGVEIDWMREPYCFEPGRENCAIMTNFMRDVRGLADKAAKRLGHPVKVLARVPADPETALRFGFDAATWADGKLVDVLVPCPRWETTDNEIATDLWKRLLRGTGVQLAPGVEIRIVRERPFYVSVEQLMGAAAWHYSAGADGFYLYNYFDDPGWKEGDLGYWRSFEQSSESAAVAWGNQVKWLKMIGHPDKVLAAPRDHVLTYRDIVPLWGSREHALPVKLGKGWLHYFRLATGFVPSGRKLKLRLGVVGDAKLRVFANSRPCALIGTEKCVPALTDAPLQTFEVPAFAEDSLVVEVSPDATVEITFLDLQVR